MEQQTQTTPQTSPAPTPTVVKVPLGSDAEMRSTIGMVLGARLDLPATQPVANRGVGAQSLASIQSAARLGTADDFAVTLLAISGIPRYSPSGEDNAIETSARYMNDALAVPTGNRVGNSCLRTERESMEGCRITPVTRDEQRIVLVPNDTRPETSNMVPNRTIPISPASAFTAGYTDTLVNPQRYLPTGPDGTAQNLTPARNAARVRGAVASENPGVNPDAALRDIAVRCLENSPSVEIRQCAIAGARSGVIFSGDNPEVQSRYTQPPVITSAPVPARP